MSDFNVKDALAVDKHALDEEWIRQPDLIRKATDMLADVTFIRDKARAKLSYESAKLANIIRSDPDEYGIVDKVTDAKVKEIVTATDHIYQMEQDYYDAEAEVIATNGVRRALEHKKSQLEELTRLFLSGYWAKPYISQEDREQYKESTKYDQTDELKNNSRLMNTKKE